MVGETSPLKVAIIGSGPSGYYTAEALCAHHDNIEIDVLDRLPTPFGLIRGGVAPDHQSIKGVVKRYEKVAERDNVHFIGNLDIGKDVSLAEIEALYDAVVITTGAGLDRPLGIPGDDKTGVIGSACFVGWYNSHPDFTDLDISLSDPNVVVIGNGNVAIDVVRVLSKTEDEMATSDIAEHAKEKLRTSRVRDLYVVGRRGPLEASFTIKELRELGELTQCTPLVHPEDMPDEERVCAPDMPPIKKKICECLRGFSENAADDDKCRLHLRFYARPIEILGGDHVTGVRFERTRVEDGACIGTGETFDVDCQLVIPCIGYRSAPIEGAPFDDTVGRFINDDGVIRDGLYVAGWARRGPTGTIGTNKPDGENAAKHILTNHAPSDKEGHDGLMALATSRDLDLNNFAGWKKIDEAEKSRAKGLAPRAKYTHIDDMMRIALAR